MFQSLIFKKYQFDTYFIYLWYCESFLIIKSYLERLIWGPLKVSRYQVVCQAYTSKNVSKLYFMSYCDAHLNIYWPLNHFNEWRSLYELFRLYFLYQFIIRIILLFNQNFYFNSRIYFHQQLETYKVIRSFRRLPDLKNTKEIIVKL